MAVSGWTQFRLDEGPDVLSPFGPVAVKDAVTGTAIEDQVQLPGQVDRVAQVRAHALAGERRHQVGRVPGQQQPAAAPAVAPAGLEGIDGVPLQIRFGGADPPRLEQPPGGLLSVELLDRLGGQAHELEPPPSRTTGD
jgi:hypothetical protein